jgi:hypothetical protein
MYVIAVVQCRWVGLREQCYRKLNATDEELRLLWNGEAAQANGAVPTNTFEEAQAFCGSEASCCLLEFYYNHLPVPPPPPPPPPPPGQGCARGYDSNTLPGHPPAPDHFTMCGETCCRADVHGDACHYTADMDLVAASPQGECTTPPAPPPPPAGVTDASGSECDETSYPDRDHGTICGECKVLVNHFNSQYVHCDGYCASINRTCTGAYEESADTCEVQSVESCTWAGDTSDAICECGAEATTAPPGPPACIDNVVPLRPYGVHACPDVVSFCSNAGVAATCCKTCAPLTPWCAAHGIEEADWSLRTGLKDPFLTLLETTCQDVAANFQCSQTLQELFDTVGLPAGVSPVSPDGLAIARQVSASGALTLANYSCPESCGICVRGDDVHRPPQAPRLNGEGWACDAGPPTPGSPATGGAVHSFHFTCPQDDPQIGGASENAAPYVRRTPA